MTAPPGPRPGAARRAKAGDQPLPSEGTGWRVVSYLIGGMALYGGIGWLVGRWTHIAVLFPIGMLVGMALALVMIVLRFARPSAAGSDMRGSAAAGSAAGGRRRSTR